MREYKEIFYKILISTCLCISFTVIFSNVTYASEIPLESTTLNVTYEDNMGASGVAPIQEPVEENSDITLPENTFTRENYQFVGWSDGTNTYNPGSVYKVITNTVFTAQWLEITTFIDNTTGTYTVNGNADDDTIIISNDDSDVNVILVKVTSNGVTKTYELSNKTKITIDAGKGNDTIYYDLTEKSAKLTDIVVLGGQGKDLITTHLTVNHRIHLPGVNLLLKAEKVLFDIQPIDGKQLEIAVNNLIIKAAPTEEALYNTSQDIKVVFRNVNIQAVGDFTVDANSYISNGKEVEDIEVDSTSYEIILEEQVVDTVVEETSDVIETVVNVAPISVKIELDTSVVSANNISLQTSNDITMKTGSNIVPITVTVADLESNISVLGDSSIESMNDIILKSSASMTATNNTSANIPLPISMALMIINSNVAAAVGGSTKLKAGGNISIIAENHIDTLNLAHGDDDDESGGFVAITVVNQNTAASMKDTSSVISGNNLSISATEVSKTQTFAQSGGTGYIEDPGGTNELSKISFLDILNILSDIPNPSKLDLEGNPIKLLGTESINKIESSFNQSISGFNENATEGDPKESSMQMVGAVGVTVVDVSNQAVITTTNQVHISGLVTVIARGVSNHILIADASLAKPTDDPEENIPFGMGVSVAIGKLGFENTANIGNHANITANGVTVEAQTGNMKLSEDLEEIIHNQLKVGSKAGYNNSDFGIGGAIAVNLYHAITKATIADSAIINLIGNANTTNIIVLAKDFSSTETVADASSQDNEALWNDIYKYKVEPTTPNVNTGIGSGIAISIFDNEVIASLGNVEINGVVNNLIINTSSQGSNNTAAAAGVEGGTCIIPVLALNMVNNYIEAKIYESGVPIIVKGIVEINASGIRNSQTEANAQAGGEKVAVGAAVAIGLIDTSEYALLERSIGSSGVSAQSITVSATGIGSHEVASYAGMNGGKEDSDATSSDDPSSITSIINSAVQGIGSLRSSEGLPEKDTTTTASTKDAETTEGKLNFAASLALNIFKSNTLSGVGSTVPITIYTGDLTVITLTNKDAIANANASTANNPSTTNTNIGVGAAAGILDAKTINSAYIGSNTKVYANGDIIIKSDMIGVEETTLDEDGNEVITENREHNYGVAAQSGAGGSNLSIAGSVAIAIVDTTFEASVHGELNALGNIDMDAVAVQVVETASTAQAVSTISGKRGKKRNNNNTTTSSSGVGIGASFAMSKIFTRVSAYTSTGSVLKSGGNIRVGASLSNDVTTTAEAGEGEEEEEPSPTPTYSKTALDAAVAMALSEIIVEAVIGAAVDENNNITVGGNLIILADVISMIRTETKSNTNATNAAIGATVSLNVVTDNITANLAGNALVTGDVLIKANANTEDMCISSASARGVVTKKYADKLGVSEETILGGGGLSKEQSSLATSLKALDDQKELTQTKNVDQSSGQTSTGSKISIAAAIAVNIIEHNVTSSATGRISNANTIQIIANSINNFKTYATGVTVNNGNAISVAVAVAINNSKNQGILGTVKDIQGDILVSANTQNNISEAYKSSIAAQAIAGSKAGTEGKFGAAGAVAVLVSNAQTKAYILNNSEINTLSTLLIEAIETSKLAIRSWAGTKSGGEVGIGAAFAVLYANNQITAYIGDGSTIEAKAICIKATKEKVESSTYESLLEELKELLSVENSVSQDTGDTKNITVNTETISKILERLENLDFELNDNTYLNYLTYNNYYIEAVGGSISSTTSQFAGAGSFAFLFFKNRTEAYIGNGVTITLFGEAIGNSIEVIADSHVEGKVIGGSVASGGTAAGLTAVVFDNKDTILAYLGEDVIVSGLTKDLVVSADAIQSFWTVTLGASKADKAGISGIVNVMLTDNQVKAAINADSSVEGSGNITIKATNTTDIRSILGGAVYGKSTGVGVSSLFLTVSNDTEAFIGDSVIINLPTGILTIVSNSDESILTVSVNGAASQGTSVSVGPAIKLIDSQVKAYIGIDGKISVGKITITADSVTNMIGIAGGISASFGGNVSVGAVIDVNTFDKIVHSYIGDRTIVMCIGDITVQATSIEKIISFVLGVAISSGVSGEGSVAVDVLSNDVRAYLGVDSKVNFESAKAGNLTIIAKDHVTLLIIAGGISGSTGSAAVGISTGTVTFEGMTIAYIGDGANINASQIYISAETLENIMIIVASGGVTTGSVSINGAVNVLVFKQSTIANIGSGAQINANGGVTLEAKDITDLILIAGNIGASGSVAVGAANITTSFNKLVSTYINKDTSIRNNSNHAIGLYSYNEENMILVAVGFGGSGNTAVQGSIIVLVLEDNISSYIVGNTNILDQIKIVTNGSIVLLAENEQSILNIAGSAVGSGTAAIGIASVVTTFKGTTQAYIGENAKVIALANGDTVSFYNGSTSGEKGDYTGILIGAYNTQNIESWVMSGAASGSVTVTGSVNVTVLDETTEAIIHELATLDSNGNIMVIAVDSTNIYNRVGTAGASGSVSVGLSSDTIVFTKQVKALVLDGTLITSLKNIMVYANSLENIHVVVAGVGGSGTVAVNGSASVIIFDNNVLSGIGTEEGTTDKYATADANGSIAIMAEDTQNITVYAGSANGSGTVSVAAGTSVITSANKVNAVADNFVHIDAYGLYALEFYTGEKGKKKLYYSGLLIGAYNTSNINQMVFCASGSGAVAAAGAVATTITKAQTNAKIQSYASINQGNRQIHQQTVRVVAVNESSIDVADGGAAGSLYVGIGAAAVVIVQNKVTTAEISNHTRVYAAGDITIIGRTENIINIIVVSMGGAIVGVSGSVGVISIGDSTSAIVGSSSQLIAGQNVNILSYANHFIDGKTGSIAGGAVAIGGSVITITMTAITVSKVDQLTFINAGGSIYLLSNSYENIKAVAAGAAGAAGISATGSVVVVILNVTTQALLGDNVNILTGQELKIHGKDQSTINGLAGGAAYGGAAGVGGSVVTVLFRNTVTAGIGNNGTVHAGTIAIVAETDREIITGSAMLSAGYGAVSGSVIVISVGKATNDEDTSKALQGEGSNTIEQSQGDISSALNNSKINLEDNVNNQEYVNQVNAQISAVSISLANFFHGVSVADKTIAFIGDGGSTVATSGNIVVSATESTRITADGGAGSAGAGALGGAVIVVNLHGTTESHTGGRIESVGNLMIAAENIVLIHRMQTIAGTAGAISLGGSVVILNVTGTTKAYATGVLHIHGTITISSIGKVTANSFNTYAGAVGGIGLGAAVSIANSSGVVQAYLGTGTMIEIAGNIDIKADLIVSIISNAYGASAGVIAIGISVSEVNVTANVAAYANQVQITKTGYFTVMSTITTDVTSKAYAASGGIIAGNGAVATTKLTPTATAYICGNIIEATGKVTVKAKVTIVKITAEARGASVGGITAGLALAEVTLSPIITSYIGSGTITSNGGIEVLSYYNLDIDSSNHTIIGGIVSVKAYAGGASYLVGATGAKASMIHNGSVKAYITGQTKLSTGGDVSVAAMGYENLNVEGQGLSVALGASIGAVIVNITNNLQIDAYIENSNVTAFGDIVVRAINEDIINAKAIGTSGGLLAAGAAQTATISEKTKVNAAVYGLGKLLKSTSGSILIFTLNDSTIYVRAVGFAVAGFVAGGYTVADAVIINVSNITVGTGITLDAAEDISIIASSDLWKDTYGSASAAALGGAINNVSTSSNITITTSIVIQESAVLIANRDINILAVTLKYYKAYATAIAGGVLAKGVAIAEQYINDSVSIRMNDYVRISAGGSIAIHSNSSITDGTTPISQAIGGAGGLVAGTSVLARLNTVANSIITTGRYVDIESLTDAVSLIATGRIISTIYSKIKFTIDGLSNINTESLATSTINSIVTLGYGTKIEGVNVTIHGEVNKITVYADAFSETGSIINTQSKPSSKITTTAIGKVEGTFVHLIASNKLGIYGTVNDISLKAKSYGYTAGATGSVISTCENNAAIYGVVNIQNGLLNDTSVLMGRDIDIKATSPDESSEVYSMEATYKADTVIEFVKQTIKKVVKVVKKVTEKITKWMPWPASKIVKWVVKTVVKYVTVFVDILVKVVLQSDTDSVTNGSYSNQNNVTLNGDIYYGANVPIHILIDQYGAISGAHGIVYNKDEIAKIITIVSYESESMGSLLFSSYLGEISGSVIVHSNAMLSELKITNESLYHLVIMDLSLTKNDNPNASNYQISCSENNLIINDVTDIIAAPMITIISINNTDLTFAGTISGYSVILSITMNGGNVYMTPGSQLEINKITITGAKNVGTVTNRFHIIAFISTNLINQSVNPEVKVLALENVYVTIALRKYIDNTEGNIDISTIQMLDGLEVTDIHAGKNLSIHFTSAALIVAQNTFSIVTPTYTYIQYNIEQVYIEEAIEGYSKYDKQLIDGLLYTRYIFNDVSNSYIETYYTDEACTIEYMVPEGYHIIWETIEGGVAYYLISNSPITGFQYIDSGLEYTYDTTIYNGIGFDVDQGYYLIKQTEELVTVELSDTISVTNGSISVVFVNGKYYIHEAYGEGVSITSQGTQDNTSDLYLIGNIVGTSSVSIQTYNSSNVFLTGLVSTNGNSIYMVVDGDISLNGNGRIIGNTTSTIITIETGEINTNKGFLNRTDISGNVLNINLKSGGMGTVTNPIFLTTGVGGISVTVLGAYPIVLRSNTNPLYIKNIVTSGEVIITSKVKVLNVVGNILTNITASKLTLEVSESNHGIGTGDDYIITNIGSEGLSITAMGHIYLRQVDRPVFATNITSTNGSVSLISSGNIIITNITALSTADVTSVNGSITSVVTNEAISAITIRLSAGGNIGSSTQKMVLGLGTGELSVTANNDIFIRDNLGNVKIFNVTSQVGNVTFVANGMIENGRIDGNLNFRGNNINLTASGIGTLDNLIALSTVSGLLNIHSVSGVYLANNESTLQLGEVIVTNGDFLLVSEGDLVNGLAEGINLVANNIKVLALGKNIGSSEKLVIIDTDNNGYFVIQAGNVYMEETGSLYIKEVLISGEMILKTGSTSTIAIIQAYGNVNIITVTGDIHVDTIITEGNILLTATLGGIINDKLTTGSNLSGFDFTVNVGKGIGRIDKHLLIDMSKDGTLTARGSEEIFIRIISGDARIDSIKTSKDVTLIAYGSILNGDKTKTNIVGSNISLQSENGTIGLLNSNLTIQTLDDGHLNAMTTNQGIYIYGVLEDLRLDHIYAGNGSVVIRGEYSIFNGLTDNTTPNMIGSTLTIEAEKGSIGQIDATTIVPIRMELPDHTRIDVKSEGNVYLEEQTGNLGLGIIDIRGTNFYLTVPGDIYTTLTMTDMKNGVSNITAKNVVLRSLNGKIGEDKNDNLTYIDEDYYGWITTTAYETEKKYELSAYAQGDIFIRELNRSLIVGEVKSIVGNGSLSAYMDLKSYNDGSPERINVTGKDIYIETTTGMVSLVVKATGDVVINSCGSISNMNGEGVDSILISGNNITIISKIGGVGEENSYIEIDTSSTGILNVIAYKGIYIREISGNLTIGSIISQTGDVMIEVANGTFISYSKDGSINIIGNNVKLVSQVAGIGSEEQSILIDSQGSVTLKAIGDIYLFETNGNLVLKSVETSGNITLDADGDLIEGQNILGTVITGNDISLTSINGGIGTKEQGVTVDLGLLGRIRLKASQSIYLDSINGGLRIVEISTSQDIALTAKGSITNASLSGTTNLSGRVAKLISHEGSIGTQETMLVISIESISGDAREDISIYSKKNLRVVTLHSELENVFIIADGDILNGAPSNQTNIRGQSICIISNLGNIGELDKFIIIDTSDNGTIYAKANKSIYLHEAKGNINIDEIHANGHVNLSTIENIVNSTKNKINIISDSILLTAGKEIGSKETPLTVIGNKLSAISSQNMYISSKENLNLYMIDAKNADIYFISGKSINNVSGTLQAIIKGSSLFMIAEESIGTDLIPVRLNLLDGSRININAINNVYIQELTESLTIEKLYAGGNVVLTVEESIKSITDQISIIKAVNIVLTAKNGSIGSKNIVFIVDTQELGNLTATAKDSIYLKEAEGDFRVNTISAGKDLWIESTGKILNRSTSLNVGNLIGSTITLQGMGDVGDSNQYMIIDIIGEGNVLASAIGDIYISELNGDLRIDRIHATDDIYLVSKNNIINVHMNKEAAIIGKNITMTAIGNIGQNHSFINLTSNDEGTLRLLSGGSIFVSEINSDLIIDYVEGKEVVYLKSTNSILGIKNQVNIRSNNLVLEATQDIGTMKNPLQISTNKISAIAGNKITLTSSDSFYIHKMNAREKIWLSGANIYGKDITTNHFEVYSKGSVGKSTEPVLINVISIVIYASKDIYIRNSGSLAITSIQGNTVDLQAENVRGISHTAITANTLTLTVRSGIGESKSNPFTMNVNRFTGSTVNGSIYIRNMKDMIASQIIAPQSVYLLINGNLSGDGNAVTTNKLFFQASNVKINTIIRYIEGTSSKNIVIINTGKLIVGNVDSAYHGISAKGIIDITAKSPIQISEDIVSSGKITLKAGHSTTMEDRLIIDSGVTLKSHTNGVYLQAGDIIILKTGAKIYGKTEVFIVCGQDNPSKNQTLIDIAGTIITRATTISGGATTKVVVTDTMGNIKIASIDKGSNLDIRVMSLGGNMNIQGGMGIDTILLNMKDTSKGTARQIRIDGQGAQDQYTILLNATGNQYIYGIVGSGTININTTDQDEKLTIHNDRIITNSGQGGDTIYLQGLNHCNIQNLGGNNRFDFYDTPSSMNIHTTSGNDIFYIGKLVNYKIGTKTTEGWLTNGTSHKLVIETLGGNNSFTIYSTKSSLKIVGGSGNDEFMAKAFIEILSDGSLKKYKNGSFDLDGGKGYNQLVVMKSALFDSLDIEEGSVKGSGFDITFRNMDEVQKTKFVPAEESNDSIEMSQLIKYSFIQLEESRALYVIIILLLAGILIIHHRKKKRKSL